MMIRREFPGYVAVSAGMALAASCYSMLGSLFGVVHGSWIVVAIAVAGTFCGLVSASIGELAAMFPSAPGIRTYLRAAFGNYASVVVLFLYLAMVALATGVEGHVVTTVLADVVPGFPRIAAVLIVFLTVIVANLRGLEVPRTLQLGMTSLLVACTLIIGLFALFAGGTPASHDAVTSASADLADLPAAIGTAIFLFMGFEWVTPMGRSPRAYRRLIPLSMLCAIAILVVVYCVFAAGMGHRLSPDQVSGNPIPQITLGAAVLGDGGRYAIAVLSVLAMSTCLNAGLMGASRLVYGLAREGVLPTWSTRISLRTGVPINAIAMVGGLALVTALIVMHTGMYRLAGVTVAAIECFVYSGLMLAVIRLRHTRAAAVRAFRSPLPLTAQWLIALVLPLLGISALLSLSEMRLWPVTFMVALVVAAAFSGAVAVSRFAKPDPTNTQEGAHP